MSILKAVSAYLNSKPLVLVKDTVWIFLKYFQQISPSFDYQNLIAEIKERRVFLRASSLDDLFFSHVEEGSQTFLKIGDYFLSLGNAELAIRYYKVAMKTSSRRDRCLLRMAKAYIRNYDEVNWRQIEHQLSSDEARFDYQLASFRYADALNLGRHILKHSSSFSKDWAKNFFWLLYELSMVEEIMSLYECRRSRFKNDSYPSAVYLWATLEADMFQEKLNILHGIECVNFVTLLDRLNNKSAGNVILPLASECERLPLLEICIQKINQLKLF